MVYPGKTVTVSGTKIRGTMALDGRERRRVPAADIMTVLITGARKGTAYMATDRTEERIIILMGSLIIVLRMHLIVRRTGRIRPMGSMSMGQEVLTARPKRGRSLCQAVWSY